MAENDSQEKTEEPTAKRRQDAREKGQLARSRELNSVAALLAAAAALLMMGDSLVKSLGALLERSFVIPRQKMFDDSVMLTDFVIAILDALMIAFPIFLTMIVVAILSSIALGGWSFSAKSLAFKLEKLDPVKGMGRLFAWRGIVEMLKGMAKFLLVATVALVLLRVKGDSFLSLGMEPLQPAIAHMGWLLAWSFLILSSVLLIVVAIDVPFQLWDHQRQLRMSKQEVKEEHKQTEGSPEVKGRQRQIQMEMAQRRMMEDVPSADVVITNPTHYAVALRYDAKEMGAPVLVAKGSELVAGKIRQVAQENDIPILSAPPLARSIYHHTEIGEAIPEGLYHAVAQVLAYVYQLKQGPIYNSDGAASSPQMNDLPIPDELRKD